MHVEPHIWVVVFLNIGSLLFFGGVSYARLKTNSKGLEEIKKALADSKGKLWEKLDGLDTREERHYRNTLVALTAITAGANPHGLKEAAKVVRKMNEENGG